MNKKFQRADLWQFLRFCMVGVSNTAIDFAVLNILIWFFHPTDTWRTLAYNSLAVLLGSINSFFWNKYWTFQKRSAITFLEIWRFCVIAFATILLNDMLMWLLGRMLPTIMNGGLLGANVLKLGAILGTMSISFFGMRLWVFFQKRQVGEMRSLADMETARLPVLKLAYDVNLVIGGAIRPVYEMDTLVLPAIPGRNPDAYLKV